MSISAKIKEKWAAVLVTVIGTVGAIVYPMDNITDFLYLIGSVFAPMIAIQIADFFLLKRDHSGRSMNTANMVIWLLGFLAYRGLMQVDTSVGSTLPDMAVTVALCLGCHALAGRKRAVEAEA